MGKEDILLTEYQALRKEILARLQIHHYIILAASLLWPIFIIAGIVLVNNLQFYTFLLLIPLVFTGIVFNYQSNQRVMEATARYIEEKIRPKAQEIIKDSAFEWEKYFAGQKKRWQFSSIYTLFSLLMPFFIPIILLFINSLTEFQKIIAYLDLFLLIVIIINFRYKLYRVK